MSAKKIRKLIKLYIFVIATLSVEIAHGGKIVVNVSNADHYSIGLFTAEGEQNDESLEFKAMPDNSGFYADNIPSGEWRIVLGPLMFSGFGGPCDIDAAVLNVSTGTVYHTFNPESADMNIVAELSPCLDENLILVKMQRVDRNKIDPVFERWFPLERKQDAPLGRFSGTSWGPMPAGQYLLTIQYNHEEGEPLLIGSILTTVPDRTKDDILMISINSQVKAKRD